MLEIVLVISVIVVLTAVALYRVDAGVIVFLFGIGFVLSVPFFWTSAKTLFLVYPALFAMWVVCRRRNVRRRVFAGCAAASVTAAWGIAMALFLPRWAEQKKLAADFPVVRMDERLAYEQRAAPLEPEMKVVRTPLPSDDAVAEASGVHYHWGDRRGSALATLERTHESFVDAFTEQEGFGFIRMIHMPARDEYIRLPKAEPIALQPPPPDSRSAGVTEETRPIRTPAPLRELHEEAALDFVNSKGFGLALDGEEWQIWGRIGAMRVRGFEPHGFRAAPDGSAAGDDWQLTKLELVSLLKHDPPAVYVSEHLPRMEELASNEAPIRPLDGFETSALERLLGGETVVAEESRNRIRMLGGLRAGARCTQCHTVEHGHLLGAFSYELRRKVAAPGGDEKVEDGVKPVI